MDRIDSFVAKGLFWLALGFAAGGCGETVTVQSAGSGGGSTSASSGGGTAEGGSGGGTGTTSSTPPCNHLVQTGELVRLAQLPGTVAWFAALHSLPDGRTAIVSRIAVGGMGPDGLASTSIAWTKDWPPAASLPVKLADQGSLTSPIGRAGPQGIALLVPPKPGMLGVSFGFGDPQNGGFSEVAGTDPKAVGPALLAGDESGQFLVGTKVAPDGGSVFRVGWVQTAGKPSYTGPLLVNSDLSRSMAVPVTGGWLLAGETQEKGCAPASCATTIQVTRFDDDQAQSTSDAAVHVGGLVGLVARPGGAWLLTRSTEGILGAAARRLGPEGQVELGPVDFSVPGLPKVYAPAIGALDGGLILTLSPDPAGPDGGPDQLTVVVADEKGNTIASAPLPGVSASYDVSGEMTFDAATRKALLAISMVDKDPPNLTSIHVARYSCQ